ncbi:MAG: hypothetical protein AB1402_02630 [Bacillota bacterium]
MDDSLQQLRRVPLFARLEPGDLEKIAAQMHERRFGKGRIIFTEGEPTCDRHHSGRPLSGI